MLQEHDSPFEDIDFDSPQRSFSLPTHSLQIDTLYHHDSQNDDIQRARNRRSNTQEQQSELLEYIAAKEKIISDLEEQLHGHQMDLKLLKENWTRIVTQCSRPSTLESSLQSNQDTQGTQEKVYETQAIRNVNTQPIKKVNTQSINDVSMVGTKVTHKESPTSPYDGISQGLASAYQNLRDTLENVAPTER
jgi:predicted RNase H-like nuclease (RuvC/YqgF family)